MNCRKSYIKSGKYERYLEVSNAWRRRYRIKTGTYKYKMKRWCDWEDELVLKHSVPDRELSEKLQRSLSAIQVRRSRLKKEMAY